MRRFLLSSRFPKTLGGLAVALAIGACAKGPSIPTAPDPVSNRLGRFIVTNDRTALARRVHDARGEVLKITPDPGMTTLSSASTLKHTPAPPPHDIALREIARVDPPVLNDVTLQATHIAMQRGKVYVSYNAMGPLHIGAIDVFDVVPKIPQLVSFGRYADTDVNAIDAKDGRLFMAVATEDPSAAGPAALDVINLDDDLLTTEAFRVSLPSYAGTGVVANGGLVFATSGDGANGGIGAFDALSLQPVWHQEFADARAVAADGTGVLTMSGQPCTLRMFDGAVGGAPTASCTPGGATIPHSKATLAIHQGLAFVAAGDAGTKVVRLADHVVTSVVPVPPVPGLAPELTVTNAVAVSGNLVYMANGGAGLWVARLKGERLEVAGRIEFGDGPSVNFVAAHGNLLFVATGTGGLRIIEVRHGAAF